MGGGQEGSDHYLPSDKQTRFPAGELGAEPPSGPALRTRLSSGLDAGLCHGGKSSPNACLPLFWYLALSLQLYYVQHHSLPFLKFPVLFASPERRGGPAREARAVGQAGHVAPRRTQGKRGQGARGREARQRPCWIRASGPGWLSIPVPPAGARRQEVPPGTVAPWWSRRGGAGPGRGWRLRDPGPGSAQAGMEALEMKQRRKREGTGKMKEEREGRRGGCGAGP